MGSLRLFVRTTYRPDRLGALTDGVYAIVLTLLVLDLKSPELPGLTNPQLREDLFRQGPNFAAYLISFFAVSYFWIQHHRLFASIHACDGTTIMLNFAHLLFISLTPYTASLIGHYEGDRVATIVFSLALGLASLAGTTLAHYISKKEDWQAKDGDGVWVTLPWWSSNFGPLIAAVSILVSFVSIEGALVLWLLLPLRNFLVLQKLSPPR